MLFITVYTSISYNSLLFIFDHIFVSYNSFLCFPNMFIQLQDNNQHIYTQGSDVI